MCDAKVDHISTTYCVPYCIVPPHYLLHRVYRPSNSNFFDLFHPTCTTEPRSFANPTLVLEISSSRPFDVWRRAPKLPATGQPLPSQPFILLFWVERESLEILDLKGWSGTPFNLPLLPSKTAYLNFRGDYPFIIVSHFWQSGFKTNAQTTCRTISPLPRVTLRIHHLPPSPSEAEA